MLNRDFSNRLDHPEPNPKQPSIPGNLLQDLAGTVEPGLAITDETGRIILWNQSMTLVTGLPSDKVLGTRIWDVPFSLLPAELQTLDNLERMRERFLSVLKAEPATFQSQKMELDFTLDDGTRMALAGSIQIIATDKGNYLVYNHQNIGTNQPGKDWRTSNNEKFRELVEQARDGIIILDENATILEWSDGWEQLVGIGRNETIGMNLSLIMPGLFLGSEWKAGDKTPDIRERILHQLGQIASSGVSLLTEVTVRHKDGTHKWIHAITFPIHANKATLFATIARDLSSLKQTEERLQRYARQLDTLRIAGLEISAELGMDSLIWMIAPRTVELLNGTGMALYLHNPEKNLLELAISLGDNLPELEKKVQRGEALAGMVWESNQSILLENFHTGRTQAFQQSYWGKVAGTPIIFGNVFLGVLFVFSNQKFFESDLKMLELFGTHAASAIRNARLHQQLSQLAITDSLTGIYNRRHFFEMAEKEFHQAVRYKRAFSIIIFDLDRFKEVNDTLGHTQGDQVLRTVVQRCANVLREADVLGRYGGEEFVIALPETGEKDALALAERLRQELASKPVETSSEPVIVTASFGVASFIAGITELMQVINRADVALYQAKQCGRNQAMLWKPSLTEEVSPTGIE